MDVKTKVMNAKRASIILSSMGSASKDAALRAMAEALDSSRHEILEANAKDLAMADVMVKEGDLSKALFQRLKVNDGKIDRMIAGIEDVIGLEDPVGRTIDALELDVGLELYQVSAPIGLIGVIFESRPDVVPQIMSLCLKSGNATVFKGGSEARNSNRAIFQVLKDAIAKVEGMPSESFQLMETREDVSSILEMDEYIDLLIPRGSNEFVRYIQDNTRIPVLGHASGICHSYVDSEAELEMAWNVCLDAKVQYPAVCNAMETLLVHASIVERFLPVMGKKLQEKEVRLICDERSKAVLEASGIQGIDLATEKDWGTEYNDLVLNVRTVDSMDEAIWHINTYGSHHTDAIITSSMPNAKRFVALVDSSSVMINSSTRFADGYRYGKGAEVGISTNKIHSRGPVGMEGLMIYKYVLVGNGQAVRDYASGERTFTHRRLKKQLDL
jgi:glutamate-5-semialdehyde dehydrogenase